MCWIQILFDLGRIDLRKALREEKIPLELTIWHFLGEP
jgi:hypothetical protein